MRPTDATAFALVLAGALVLSLTFAGLAPFAVTGGGSGACTPGADAYSAYLNGQGAMVMDGFSCTGTGSDGGVTVYGWVTNSAGTTVQSVSVSSDQYGNFALVFGVLPAGSYSATASLCPQSGQSACSGQTDWTAGFELATVTTSQSSTVSVIQSQTLTSVTANGCVSNCGVGKPILALGYFVALALFVSGALVFAVGREEEG